MHIIPALVLPEDDAGQVPQSMPQRALAEGAHVQLAVELVSVGRELQANGVFRQVHNESPLGHFLT